jgi:hypothetical protein
MSAAKDIINPDQARTLCSVCAWRKDCKKKFSFEQGGSVKCQDFSQDLTLKPGKTTNNER